MQKVAKDYVVRRGDDIALLIRSTEDIQTTLAIYIPVVACLVLRIQLRTPALFALTQIEKAISFEPEVYAAFTSQIGLCGDEINQPAVGEIREVCNLTRKVSGSGSVQRVHNRVAIRVLESPTDVRIMVYSPRWPVHNTSYEPDGIEHGVQIPFNRRRPELLDRSRIKVSKVRFCDVC